MCMLLLVSLTRGYLASIEKLSIQSNESPWLILTGYY